MAPLPIHDTMDETMEFPDRGSTASTSSIPRRQTASTIDATIGEFSTRSSFGEISLDAINQARNVPWAHGDASQKEAMEKREEKLARREKAAANREESAANREVEVAKRELAAARSEKELIKREKAVQKSEEAVAENKEAAERQEEASAEAWAEAWAELYQEKEIFEKWKLGEVDRLRKWQTSLHEWNAQVAVNEECSRGVVDMVQHLVAQPTVSAGPRPSPGQVPGDEAATDSSAQSQVHDHPEHDPAGDTETEYYMVKRVPLLAQYTDPPINPNDRSFTPWASLHQVCEVRYKSNTYKTGEYIHIFVPELTQHPRSSTSGEDVFIPNPKVQSAAKILDIRRLPSTKNGGDSDKHQYQLHIAWLYEIDQEFRRRCKNQSMLSKGKEYVLSNHTQVVPLETINSEPEDSELSKKSVDEEHVMEMRADDENTHWRLMPSSKSGLKYLFV